MRLKPMLHTTDEREPIGIVIADGAPMHATPRFSAFVWGPVPDDAEPRGDAKRLATAHCCA